MNPVNSAIQELILFEKRINKGSSLYTIRNNFHMRRSSDGVDIIDLIHTYIYDPDVFTKLYEHMYNGILTDRTINRTTPGWSIFEIELLRPVCGNSVINILHPTLKSIAIWVPTEPAFKSYMNSRNLPFPRDKSRSYDTHGWIDLDAEKHPDIIIDTVKFLIKTVQDHVMEH